MISLRLFLFTLISVFILSACGAGKPKRPSLADIDVSSGNQQTQKVFIKPKSEEEIRRAYSDYLKTASADDRGRINALSRLAELEFKYTEKLLKEKEQLADEDDEDAAYNRRLDKTIGLLTTALRDYPKAKNNDTLLYQLAKAHAQRGNHEQSVERLKQLAENYPTSPYYAEAQFRLGEDLFSRQQYASAEHAYTEVMVSPENQIYYEKSVFKRGWTRFKQQYYIEAADDFLHAIHTHEFAPYEKLNKTELEQFNEYFRALGLTFSYLGGAEPLAEYFQKHPDFAYIYHTYSMVSDIYFKQERYSDAVATHQHFIKNHPQSDNIPYSRLKVIEIWQKSGFTERVFEAIEDFYVHYNPSSKYWENQNENSSINRAIRRSLKEYVVLVTGYYHNQYQKSDKASLFDISERWYQRYFKHYEAYGQQDNMFYLYAELQAQNKRYSDAFSYYEKAAYHDGLIINKKAAYASITISDRLNRSDPGNKTYLQKHIDYALKYAQTYPSDTYTSQLLVHAAELAYKSKRYPTAIELCDIYLGQPDDNKALYMASIKAQSYFDLNEFAEAESLYHELLDSPRLSSSKEKEFEDKLALAIYKQGDAAKQAQNYSKAVFHYARVSEFVSHSDIASTGLYDAIALNMQYQQWNGAINLIERFQSLYPNHKYKLDVSKKLSVAYLKSDQGVKAAKEFEKLAKLENNKEVQAAALWQAAELYENKQQIDDAIRAYERYAKQYPKPFPQHMEALQKLVVLNDQEGAYKSVFKWRKQITKADSKALNNVKTDRTKFLASMAYLGLANSEKMRFDNTSLTLPLAKSLKRKKNAMQSAVKLYGNASKYKVYEVVTESTHSIATIYKDFSTALLNSDRPTNLNDEELDQYEILLEDQAYPFEDKAIEFYEINLARIKDGYYNNWIERSHKKLIELFPVRYNRKPKPDAYVQDYR